MDIFSIFLLNEINLFTQNIKTCLTTLTLFFFWQKRYEYFHNKISKDETQISKNTKH